MGNFFQRWRSFSPTPPTPAPWHINTIVNYILSTAPDEVCVRFIEQHEPVPIAYYNQRHMFNEYTPLAAATVANKPQTIAYLLARGANRDAPCPRNHTLTSLAALHNHSELVEYFAALGIPKSKHA